MNEEQGFISRAWAWTKAKVMYFANFIATPFKVIALAICTSVVHMMAHATMSPFLSGVYAVLAAVTLFAIAALLWKEWPRIKMWFSSEAKTISSLDSNNVNATKPQATT